MQLYLCNHRDVDENPIFENRELFHGITKSIFVVPIRVKSLKLMSELLIEMNVKMVICDSTFVDFRCQEFHSIGE
jgi:hypothetical protein